jgi:sec-independent protein translocase protein TatA
MNVGAPEVLVILLIALLVFGPHKLPEVARQVGGAMRELRRMQDGVKAELRTVMDPDATAPTYASPPPPADTTTPDRPALEEPDHTDVPTPHIEDGVTPNDAGFEGPGGSFS